MACRDVHLLRRAFYVWHDGACAPLLEHLEDLELAEDGYPDVVIDAYALFTEPLWSGVPVTWVRGHKPEVV